MSKPLLLDLKRLWRDIHIAPESDARGYMGIFADSDDLDSLAHYGFYPIDSLAERECLFLLGRPGAGKSAEIERIAQGHIAAFRDEWIVPISCKEAGLDLHPEIIRDPKWIAGLGQSKPVRLILDGLDEGFLRDPAYFARLKRTLQNLRSQHQTLRLLLTCRPAEWDPEFGKSVHESWRGKGNPSVFAIEPLSGENRRSLAKHWSVKDSKDFSRWTRSNRFEEFEAWPRSLKWLAEQFEVGGAENLTYTRLCQLRVTRSFGEDKRLSEARLADKAGAWSSAIMLIAATLVFCGRKGIALDRSDADCLTLDEIFDSSDHLKIPGTLPLTREDVRQAVRTSHLIEAHGEHYRFENQSDLEFLAAAMLASLDIEQLGELLGSPDHEKRWRVFPQLATTAANLAAQSPDFFDYLLANDPRVLMRADFASKGADDRRIAVDAILHATAQIGATGEHDQHAHFSTLRHPEITAQLRPWIFDKKQSRIVRELAFDIARDCCGGNLWKEFETAAAGGDDFAYAKLPLLVALFGDIWPEEKLRVWAGDAKDELAGAALNALLDRGLKLRDLLEYLREPTSDVFGLYQIHLKRLQQECVLEDIPATLPIIGKWPGVSATHGAIRELVFALVSKGVSALDRSDVREALTTFFISRYEAHDWLDERSGSPLGLDNAHARRSLLLALAEDWPADSRAELMPFNYPLLREDYAWLLESVVAAKGNAAVVLAKFAANLAWQFDEALRDPFERAYEESPEFRAQLPAAGEAGIYVTLQNLRTESDARYRLRLEEIQAKRKRPHFSAEELFTDALARCRAGHFAAWTTLCYAFSQPKSEHDASDFFRNSDVRQLVGWTETSEELQTEITEFARQFLLHVEVPMPEPRTVPWSFFGLAYALSLHNSGLKTDKELNAAIRPIWPLALLRHSDSQSGTIIETLATLTAIAPSVVADACRHEFRERWDRNEPIYDQLLSAAWCPETEGALASILVSKPLQPETYISGVAMLAGYNAELAEQVATGRLTEHVTPLAEDSAPRRAAIAVCLFLIVALWEKAWPHLIANRTAARQLLLEYSRWLDYHEREQRIAALPIPLVAGLYGLMMELFPLSEAPHREGGYTPTSLDDAYSLRGHLQRSLEARGAHAELSAIYKRCEETRDAWWTPTSIDRAQNIAHASRREPLTAAEFIRVVATENGTVVSDNDSLQRAVLASLRRYEQRLKPDGLIAIWDKSVPRSEDALQSAIAAHLRREFEEKRIVVNMETKVLHERSDIRVQAGPYVVTLEVKLGHSNDRKRPLRTAMRSQLRTYLENQSETHGIYVVGWFFCPAFRFRGLRDMKTLLSSRRYFDSQARRISTGGFAIAASVIDCRWPETIAARAHRKKAARRLVGGGRNRI
jgi:hypothetical protein